MTIAISKEIKRQSPYPTLLDIFSNLEAKARFDIAKEAGYLDSSYKTNGINTLAQLQALA